MIGGPVADTSCVATDLTGGNMSADAHSGDNQATDKPKKNKKKMILIALSVLGLAGGAGVSSLFISASHPDEAEVVEEDSSDHPTRLEVADLGVFVVNLSENVSFLKTRIMMEYDANILDKQTLMKEGGEGGGEAHGGGGSGGKEGEGASGAHPYIGKRENQLRDVVIRILSSKKSSDLLTNDGKGRLKEELVDGLNEAIGLEEPPVTGILFTEFIIQ